MATELERKMLHFRAEIHEHDDVMVDEMITRMRTDTPAFFSSDDPDYVAVYTASCVAHVEVMVDEMTGNREIPDSLPFSSVEETRTVAQWGISLEALIQTYRSGHSVIWEHTMNAADVTFSDPAERSAVLKASSRYLFAYFDRMIALVTEVYENERTSLFQETDRRRRQLVRDLLDGLPVDHAKLNYRIDEVHVAAIATGEGAEQLLRKLGAQAGTATLTVRGPSQAIWAWFGGAGLREPSAQRTLIESVPDGVFVAFGDPAEGVEGFRISHREAREAYRIGRQMGDHALQYGDVALLSLLSRDEVLAREFVQRELRSLADDDIRTHELRQTVRAYFDAGHNASAAAARLMLNDRTVGYRLRTVEERLGHPLLARRDELSVALRLYEMFSRRAASDSEATPAI